MNKKVVWTLIALVVLLIGGFFGMQVLNKDVQEGSKVITIEVVSEEDNINTKEEINTDEEKLGPVLENKEGFKIVDGMVMSVNNIDLSKSDSEYWYISINGEDAQVGANDLIIKNGDIIKFKRIKFK